MKCKICKIKEGRPFTNLCDECHMCQIWAHYNRFLTTQKTKQGVKREQKEKLLKETYEFILEGELYKKFHFRYYVSKSGKLVSWKKTKALLIPQHNNNGYVKFTLMIDGKQKNKYLHHIIWETWMNEKIDGDRRDVERKVISHKDNNKDNNNLSNLECTTQIKSVKNYHKNNEKQK